jgi:hypothetical protein
MNITELAQKLTHTEVFVFTSSDLEDFATAIAKQAVEDYKAGLVPVGYIHNNGTEEFFLTKTCENCIPLYALGETK